MPICPRCLGSAEHRVNPYMKTVCPLCDGKREVSSLQYAEFHIKHPLAALPSPLLTDESKEITLLPCPRCSIKLLKGCDLCQGTKLVTPIVYARWNMISKR